MMLFARLPVFLVVVMFFFGPAGCGSDHCGEDEASEHDGAPQITDLQLLDDVKALASDPWTVIIATRFKDSDGNVGPGEAEFYLNDKPTHTTVDLADIFHQSGVPLDSSGGRVALPLRFSENVSDGAKVWLGVQLIDADDHRSNCYAIKLEFEVRELAARLWQWLEPLAGLGPAATDLDASL